MRKILFIEGSNFINFPLGGTLSFNKLLIENVKEDFHLVGLADDNEIVGQWFLKNINGKEYNFYAFGRVSEVLISKLPKRLVVYKMLKRHIKIINLDFEKFEAVFTQSPHFIFLLGKFKWNKFIFCFAGLGNSVGNSKYKILRLFGRYYEKKLFKILKKNCDIILAAADEESINYVTNKYKLKNNSIKSLTTRFNPSIFNLKENHNLRNKYDFDLNDKLLISVGRIAKIKGWKDLVISFRLAKKIVPELKLIFIGDGEEKYKLEKFAKLEIYDKSILILGKKSAEEISDYLNIADLFVSFSFLEGWPTSIVEALACGNSVVTSNVSGSSQMVKNDINGYIIKNRSVQEFSKKIIMALNLEKPNPISLELATKYSSLNLNDDFKKLTQ